MMGHNLRAVGGLPQLTIFNANSDNMLAVYGRAVAFVVLHIAYVLASGVFHLWRHIAMCMGTWTRNFLLRS